MQNTLKSSIPTASIPTATTATARLHHTMKGIIPVVTILKPPRGTVHLSWFLAQTLHPKNPSLTTCWPDCVLKLR